jgi:hypothetical protein
MQLHDRNLLGLWMSPGQHGRLLCMKYWGQGRSCPVVVTFSANPLVFALAHTNSRAIFYAVRPFEWRDKFPKVSRSSRELREQVIRKYRNVIPFLGSQCGRMPATGEACFSVIVCD